MNHPGHRLGVIGAGPKGLYCLERLATHLRWGHATLRPHIHIFEPHGSPGAGPVYDPAQPHYLRLNFANGHIDAWVRGDRPAGTISQPTFVEFLRAHHPDHARADGYAPRALVGEYLEATFSSVLASLREEAAVEVHRERVDQVVSHGERFEIRTPERRLVCDEVLVATGHESRRAPSPDGDPRPALGPYPIDQPGGIAAIEPGQSVAVRGLGLTAIDVALALTEGRGGAFVAEAPGAGRYRYEPTPLSPRVIAPYSRTGRPMVPKDHPTSGPLARESIDVAGETEALAAAADRSAPEALRMIEGCIVGTAARALALTARQPAATEHHIIAHLAHLMERRPLATGQAETELRQGVEVAHGLAEPEADWALGAAWKALYPAIVHLVSARPLDPVWPRFGHLAAEMERVAFGPPAENAARFLSLVDAGVVDLSMASRPMLSRHRQRSTLELEGAVLPVDHFVDAVLAPPGVDADPSPLFASLLDAGLVRTLPHAPGIEVLGDGTCIGRSGEPTVGLAVVGRPTEGCVLGNDTLGRTLHDLPDRWARAATRRLLARRESMCP